MQLEYQLGAEDLSALLDTSGDQAYSLYNAGVSGGGDYSSGSIVLMENATGRVKFLAVGGGMYGGYGDLGFYQNGDIYVQTLTSLKTFSPDMEQAGPIFRLEDALPLGALPEQELVRYLFAFRRDPQAFDYLIVYGEMPFAGAYQRTENGAGCYAYGFTYRVGRCGSDGRLLESWDTGAPVLGDNFGLCGISLRLNGEKLTLIGAPGKGHEGFRGVFDLQTHAYTPQA